MYVPHDFWPSCNPTPSTSTSTFRGDGSNRGLVSSATYGRVLSFSPLVIEEFLFGSFASIAQELKKGKELESLGFEKLLTNS